MADSMTTEATGGIASAIGELEARHTALLEELRRVETAIGVLHELRAPRLPLGGEAPAKTDYAGAGVRAAERRAEPPADLGETSSAEDRVVRALEKARDALAPGELAGRLGIDRAQLRVIVKKLEARGLVTVSGTTMSRRVALARGALQ